MHLKLVNLLPQILGVVMTVSKLHISFVQNLQFV
jgi:hypothetical protein